MVESGNQANVFREQHAVAEHVAGHVADTGNGEVLGLRVDAEFAEMPLDRLPSAARCNAHAFMVVTRRAARCECVAEPMAVFDRDRVGDVRERCGALVSSDDEVRVVAIAPDDAVARNDFALDEVVGEVEQAANERLVARNAFALNLIACAAARQLLWKEAALGADRHDDGVLDVLRLHQAEHFGPVIVAAIGPTQSAARHQAHAQVHAFDAWAVDEDFKFWPRQRQIRDRSRIELERQPGFNRTCSIALQVVSTERRTNDVQIGAQNSVVIRAGDRLECPANRCVQLGGIALARFG